MARGSKYTEHADWLSFQTIAAFDLEAKLVTGRQEIRLTQAAKNTLISIINERRQQEPPPPGAADVLPLHRFVASTDNGAMATFGVPDLCGRNSNVRAHLLSGGILEGHVQFDMCDSESQPQGCSESPSRNRLASGSTETPRLPRHSDFRTHLTSQDPLSVF